jgi:hypothetical protein
MSLVLKRNSSLYDQDWQKESAVDDLISKTVTLNCCCCCKSAISAVATSADQNAEIILH